MTRLEAESKFVYFKQNWKGGYNHSNAFDISMFWRCLVGKKYLDNASSVLLSLGLHNFNLKSFTLVLIVKEALGWLYWRLFTHSFNCQGLRKEENKKKNEGVGVTTIIPQLLIGSPFILFHYFLLISFDLVCCFVLRYTFSIFVFACYIKKNSINSFSSIWFIFFMLLDWFVLLLHLVRFDFQSLHIL